MFLQVDVKKAAPKPANPYANPKAMRGRGAARGGKSNYIYIQILGYFLYFRKLDIIIKLDKFL